MVLDFCEYLKSKSRNGVTILDLLTDKKHSEKLQKYAEEYLNRRPYSFKGILHRYIDSEYFDRSLHRFPMDYYNNASRKQIGIEQLRRIAKEHRCCDCCERGFFEFLDSLDDNGEMPQYDFDERDLISNVQHPLINDTDEVMLHFMTSLGVDLSTEIAFLEWILDSEIEPLQISKMPVSVFESLVEKYLSCCGKGNQTKKQLLKSFKQTDNYFLSSQLERLLPSLSEKRKRSLRHVISRYCDETIPYKCVFLPLAAETEKYKKLIKEYWRDLHHISANHLDIYYSETDYGKSGSEIQNSLNGLPQNIKTTFPCIVLWGNEIKEAKSIDTSELENYEIVRVITAIVNAIKDDKSFETIVREANNMAQGIREKGRPVSNNTVNIHGDNYGVAVAENTGNLANTSTMFPDVAVFENEVNDAINRIKSLEELSEQQKNMLSEILAASGEAIKTNSTEKKEKVLSRFNDAMCFLGIVSEKVQSALSSLANLSKFLGIGQ
jgi:hypothetical protein